MDQCELESLLRPNAYPESPHSIRLVQTHISYIFLTDKYVYKVKKPVDFGFLDFSTIERRQFFCHEEVRLNRRLSPDVYIGVVEIKRSDEGLTFFGNGPTVDYAVKMIRLPEEQMLDRLSSAGLLDDSSIRRVAKAVAIFHSKAEKGAEIDKNGSLEAIRSIWEENITLASRFIGQTLSGWDIAFVRDGVEEFMNSKSELFNNRVNNGFIRDCDGDLHMENINLGDQVRIFDCIEFSNRFRYIDTASDIAFLIMDLEYHNSQELAAAFLEEYCHLTGDEDCRALVDFYKIYRAFVRGKVASLQLNDPAISEKDKNAAFERAKGYFRLSRGYLLRKNLSPTFIMVSGLMGSGKSTLSGILGRELGLKVLSSDRVRKEICKWPSISGDPFGYGLYSPEADEAVYAELLCRGIALLKQGESVIVDATFKRESDRRRFYEAASAVGVNHCLVMTNSPDDLILRRLSERYGKAGEISDGRPELFEDHKRSFEFPDPEVERFVRISTETELWSGIDLILRTVEVLP